LYQEQVFNRQRRGDQNSQHRVRGAHPRATAGHDSAEKTLIHDHIENCLEQAVGPLAREQRGPVEEFTKYP
jgi:hypothetical protein